jgi:hypothetical protein
LWQTEEDTPSPSMARADAGLKTYRPAPGFFEASELLSIHQDPREEKRSDKAPGLCGHSADSDQQRVSEGVTWLSNRSFPIPNF